MQADIKLKQSITLHITNIDINNIKNGIPIKAIVKAINQELEIPYEITVLLDGTKEDDFTGRD